MRMRRRILLALAAGAGMVSSLAAQEPGRLGVDPGQELASRQAVFPNQRMADVIAHQLRQSGHLRDYNIHVVYQNGTAELTGAVTDQTQREEALRLVQGVPGVDCVRDLLVLRGPSTTRVELRQAQGGGPAMPAPAPLPPRAPEQASNGNAVEPLPIFQAPVSPYDVNQPKMPPYAWPTYAPYNNYSRVAYPKLYPYESWPNIGPCYPFPKIPLGWRSVKLEWQDGHWWYSKHSNSYDWWRLRYW